MRSWSLAWVEELQRQQQQRGQGTQWRRWREQLRQQGSLHGALIKVQGMYHVTSAQMGGARGGGCKYDAFMSIGTVHNLPTTNNRLVLRALFKVPASEKCTAAVPLCLYPSQPMRLHGEQHQDCFPSRRVGMGSSHETPGVNKRDTPPHLQRGNPAPHVPLLIQAHCCFCSLTQGSTPVRTPPSPTHTHIPHTPFHAHKQLH